MEKIRYVDTHCHLDMLSSGDIYRSVNDVDILITVGCDFHEIKEALKIGSKYDNVYVVLGYHPYEADKVSNPDIDFLETLVKANAGKVVAIGEMGLDFYRNNASKESQYRCFLSQICIAKKLNLPVVIHSREANDETKEIIKSEKISKGVMHCFGGDMGLLKTALDSGLYISFAGNITYPKADNLRNMLRYVPLDRLLLETDSPYLSPQSVRGQKNTPSNVKYTYDFVSNLLKIDILQLSMNIYDNAKRCFNIKI